MSFLLGSKFSKAHTCFSLGFVLYQLISLPIFPSIASYEITHFFPQNFYPTVFNSGSQAWSCQSKNSLSVWAFSFQALTQWLLRPVNTQLTLAPTIKSHSISHIEVWRLNSDVIYVSHIYIGKTHNKQPTGNRV